MDDIINIAGLDAIRTSVEEIIIENLPKPLPNSLPKVMAFDSDMLPESIRDYVIDIADRQQCPIDFVAVTAICGLAAVLGRKALMCPKQNDDWKVTPNLWGAIIGRPSAMKTPAMRAALEPLKHIDSEAAKQHAIAKGEYEINKQFTELSKSSAKEKAKEHIKKGNNEEAKATLKTANFIEPPPTRNRLVVNDATVEKLGELLNENSNGLILVRDELSGWLGMLAREEYQMDRAFYLECFDGNGHYTYDRIGRGTIDIESTTLSVIGGIQPSRISPLIRDAIRGTADDGLVQRLQVTVWPDDVGSWEWIDRAPNKEARKNYQNAFDSLHNLNFVAEDGEPPCFRFTQEAQKIFIEWMNEIQMIARADDTQPAIESYLLKMPQTIASLALLFQILNNVQRHNNNEASDLLVIEKVPPLAVGITATAQALAWAYYLKSHAERLYSIVVNQGLEGARLILKRMGKLKETFNARDIQRKGWIGLSESRAIEEALDYLVDYQHLTSLEIPSTLSGGRPTTCYIKHATYTKERAK